MIAVSEFYRKKPVIIGVTAIAIIMASIITFHFLTIPDDDYLNVSALQAKDLIDTGPSLAIVDVRTEEEFKSGHIPGAINIPVDELTQRVSELDPHHSLFVYCRTGNRSMQAVHILVENEFTDIYHPFGGIVAWEQAGYPIID